MPIPTIDRYDLPEPDRWPAARAKWTLEPGRAALLVHDMQEYFLRAYRPDASPAADLVESIETLRDACAAAGVPVIFSVQPGEQTPAERGLLVDLWGAGIVEHPEQRRVARIRAPAEDDHVILKRRYSAFFDTPLQALLTQLGRDQLVITGIYGHIGCLATALDGFMRGVQPFVVADGIADFSRADHEIALRQVARTCGRVVGTEDVRARLTARADEASAAKGRVS